MARWCGLTPSDYKGSDDDNGIYMREIHIPLALLQITSFHIPTAVCSHEHKNQVDIVALLHAAQFLGPI